MYVLGFLGEMVLLCLCMLPHASAGSGFTISLNNKLKELCFITQVSSLIRRTSAPHHLQYRKVGESLIGTFYHMSMMSLENNDKNF